MYLIKNISKICISIDNVSIPPYQTAEFGIIKDRLCLNKYNNRHMIQVTTKTDNKTNAVETKQPDNNDIIIEEEKTVVEENKVSDVVEKPVKFNKRKAVKSNDENIKMKGEVLDASD